MLINNIDSKSVSFNGATRTLRHNYFANFEEIADVFERHPNCDGIAGSLPFSWIQRIRELPKEEKGIRIKQVYQLFRDVFNKQYPKEMNRKDLEVISHRFTEVLRNVGIIPEENQIVVKKRKVYGSFIRGAFTIKERGKNKVLEPLFIKQFPDLSIYKSIRNHESVEAELAIGLHLDKIAKDEHILRPYFGDRKGLYFASRYDAPPQKVKIPKELPVSAEKEETEDFFKKLMLISKDFTDIRKILAKYGFKHHDFHDQNVFIAKNKKNNLIIRLNDLGRIKKEPPDILADEKFITYNHKTKSFD